ncbi:N-6 DNA methylase [Limosilactobacillus mucosae]|uniref:site-specific DNA-methyltransferase (adenine-specific) n=1 Tax=Limosilactobacillus mucosae TaxID=97478 RepID=A0AAJ1M8C6_LIMMU|nr:DNA methyltransferase [Limosilactobacillus mucosae]MDC2829092.1 N-6 DNA methylase [Limosilactobacillus mucosae]
MERKTRIQLARDFVETWSDSTRGHEDKDRQTFLINLIDQVFEIHDYPNYILFEKNVTVPENGENHVKHIDGYIPSTRVMIEMKGRGIDLTKKYQQSDGAKLTPFEQAQRYSNYLPIDEKPRWIIVSDFDELDIHDMNKPLNAPKVIKLKDLPQKFRELEFMIDVHQQQIIDEQQISTAAGELVAKIYDKLAVAYEQGASLKDEHVQQSLNVLIVRLVFLMYVDDTRLFGQDNLFEKYLERREPQDIRGGLINLFKVLDQPIDQRDPFLSDELKAFPYVNGGMFSNEDIIIPQFTPELKDLIVNEASKGFNWSGISPTIFGAVFESTLNPETRRSGGMHYTSIENIHKVIDPLFLDDLKVELTKIKNMGVISQRDAAVDRFLEKIGHLKFFDPACGSGNFLTETYLSLRDLEDQATLLKQGTLTALALDGYHVKITNFYGIEINDFAVSVAKTAMWIAEAQTMQRSQDRGIYTNKEFFPLTTNVGIHEGNALRMDWAKIVKPYELNYIMGNPPFVGHQWRTDSQVSDMKLVFSDLKKHGKLDYVASWYAKSAKYMQGTTIKSALVSTNSICQGEPVSILWKYLTDKYNVEIQFAYRTFVWTNEAKDEAKVHCVIVGFSTYHIDDNKYLFDENGNVSNVSHINGYLIASPDIYVKSRGAGLYKDHKVTKGSQPTDGGNLLLTEKEAQEFTESYPNKASLVHRFMGSSEFLNNKKRYCLWLYGVDPSMYSRNRFIADRLEKVREMRLASKTSSVREQAQTPALFTQIRQPNTKYLAIPRVSSGKREYIPIGYEDSDVIASDALLVLPNADLFIFGLLNSSVHNSWMRTVCGRLKSDYRYSSSIYSNLPWPDNITNEQRHKVESTAKEIIDARKLYPNASLADLYNPLTMPIELRKAHRKNDKVVLKAYGLKPSASEAEIVQHLFKMYEQLTENNSEK